MLISCFMMSSVNLFPITFAGTHQTIVYGGTFFVTTDHKAITAQSHIVTPLRIVQSIPIRTSLPITTSHLL